MYTITFFLLFLASSFFTQCMESLPFEMMAEIIGNGDQQNGVNMCRALSATNKHYNRFIHAQSTQDFIKFVQGEKVADHFTTYAINTSIAHTQYQQLKKLLTKEQIHDFFYRSITQLNSNKYAKRFYTQLLQDINPEEIKKNFVYSQPLPLLDGYVGRQIPLSRLSFFNTEEQFNQLAVPQWYRVIPGVINYMKLIASTIYVITRAENSHQFRLITLNAQGTLLAQYNFPAWQMSSINVEFVPIHLTKIDKKSQFLVLQKNSFLPALNADFKNKTEYRIIKLDEKLTKIDEFDLTAKEYTTCVLSQLCS